MHGRLRRWLGIGTGILFRWLLISTLTIGCHDWRPCVGVLWVGQIGVKLANVSKVELEQDSEDNVDPETVLIGPDE